MRGESGRPAGQTGWRGSCKANLSACFVRPLVEKGLLCTQRKGLGEAWYFKMLPGPYTFIVDILIYIILKCTYI